MAKSKYEYVKNFEQCPTLLPNTFAVVRLDGRGFHRVAEKYQFRKPNDRRSLDLMNEAASSLMREVPEVVMAYGQSDEYSFVFGRGCDLFDRRESKILTTVVSTFTAHFIHLWGLHFPDQPLTPPLPSFDGRIVLYPTMQNLRDYLSWRQADCHINNLYNTTFWLLVQRTFTTTSSPSSDMTKRRTEAEQFLRDHGRSAAQKNEILFTRFGVNYNNEAAIFRKGSVLLREPVADKESARAAPEEGMFRKRKGKEGKGSGRKVTMTNTLEHADIIQDTFWDERGWLLSKLSEV